MRVVVLICVIWLVTGCSPQARLARLVDRHPELKTTDTLIRPLLIPVPGFSADTCFIDRPGDTVTLSSGRLEIQYFRQHDTVMLRGRCKPDTIHLNDTVIVQRIKLVPAAPDNKTMIQAVKDRPGWFCAAFIALVALVIFLVAKFFRR